MEVTGGEARVVDDAHSHDQPMDVDPLAEQAQVIGM